MKARLPNGVEVEGTSEEVADLLKSLPVFVPIQEFTFDPPGIIGPGIGIINPPQDLGGIVFRLPPLQENVLFFNGDPRHPMWNPHGSSLGLHEIINGEDFAKLMGIGITTPTTSDQSA